MDKGIVSTKIYDKRDDLDIINVQSLGVTLMMSVYLNLHAHVNDFNSRIKFSNGKLQKQGYQYHELNKSIFLFYRRHYE